MKKTIKTLLLLLFLISFSMPVLASSSAFVVSNQVGIVSMQQGFEDDIYYVTVENKVAESYYTVIDPVVQSGDFVHVGDKLGVDPSH